MIIFLTYKKDKKIKYERWDLNPQGFHQGILSTSRLPIPAHSLKEDIKIFS